LSVFRSHSVSALPNVESEVSQGQEWLHKFRKIWIHMSYEFICHMNSYAERTAYLWQHCLWTWCVSNFKSEHYEHTKVHVPFRNWVWILLGLLGMIMDQRRPRCSYSAYEFTRTYELHISIMSCYNKVDSQYKWLPCSSFIWEYDLTVTL
jgi:hypothetical protein